MSGMTCGKIRLHLARFIVLHVTFFVVTAFEIKHHIHMRVNSRQKILHYHNVLTKTLATLGDLHSKETHNLCQRTRLLFAQLVAHVHVQIVTLFLCRKSNHALDELQALVDEQSAFHPLQLLHHKRISVRFEE
jgi:hypothetical protein